MVKGVRGKDKRGHYANVVTKDTPIGLKEGEQFVLVDRYSTVPNPARKWWQVWKPARISTPVRIYTVTRVWE
jgi:hypothetical protein